MHTRLPPALAFAALIGCHAADSNTTSARASRTLTIVAKDYSFDVPQTVPAGAVTIRLVNQGRSVHHAQLLHLADGKTVADLTESMKNPGPLPAWATVAGGPNAGIPGGEPTEATLTLTAGTYAVVCVIPGADHIPHFAKGMVAPLTVTTGEATASRLPASDITLSLTDYAFTPSVPITAGTHTIRFENRSSQDHEAFLVRLPPGKNANDVVAWVDNQVGPPPAEPLGGITAIPAGGQAYITSEFTSGNYAFLCFLPDAKDGKMHVIHGMIREFTVS